MSKLPTTPPNGLEGLSVRRAGVCIALAGFSTAMLVGMGASHSFDVVLTRAMHALVGCYAIGLFVGWVLCSAFEESIEQHLRLHPVPNSDQSIDEIVAMKLQEEAAAQDSPRTDSTASKI